MTNTRNRTRQIPLLALLVVVAVAARCQTNEKAPDSSDDDATDEHVKWALSYVNQEYGFEFKLPAEWKGFRVVEDKWTGNSGETGPVLRIRHPDYTDQDPREDIPIMVFTREEWKRVMHAELVVSAAPFPPAETGHNAQFVFATPPRFYYDLLPGYEEVLKILGDHPMRTFVPKPGGAEETQ